MCDRTRAAAATREARSAVSAGAAAAAAGLDASAATVRRDRRNAIVWCDVCAGVARWRAATARRLRSDKARTNEDVASERRAVPRPRNDGGPAAAEEKNLKNARAPDRKRVRTRTTYGSFRKLPKLRFSLSSRRRRAALIDIPARLARTHRIAMLRRALKPLAQFGAAAAYRQVRAHRARGAADRARDRSSLDRTIDPSRRINQSTNRRVIIPPSLHPAAVVGRRLTPFPDPSLSLSLLRRRRRPRAAADSPPSSSAR